MNFFRSLPRETYRTALRIVPIEQFTNWDSHAGAWAMEARAPTAPDVTGPARRARMSGDGDGRRGSVEGGRRWVEHDGKGWTGEKRGRRGEHWGRQGAGEAQSRRRL